MADDEDLRLRVEQLEAQMIRYSETLTQTLTKLTEWISTTNERLARLEANERTRSR
jgi:hypothetical protein